YPFYSGCHPICPCNQNYLDRITLHCFTVIIFTSDQLLDAWIYSPYWSNFPVLYQFELLRPKRRQDSNLQHPWLLL
ncbi:MAG: hypothetical protein ABFS35_03760, partial [Bacteroidota bacterium]